MKIKPYLFSLLLTVLLFILAILNVFEGLVDIHFHDTYFVVAYSHLIVEVGFMFTFFTLIYFLIHKRLYSSRLAISHLFISFAVCILSFFSSLRDDSMSRTYFDYSSWDVTNPFEGLNPLVVVLILIGLLVQLLFIYNLGRSISTRK